MCITKYISYMLTLAIHRHNPRPSVGETFINKKTYIHSTKAGRDEREASFVPKQKYILYCTRFCLLWMPKREIIPSPLRFGCGWEGFPSEVFPCALSLFLFLVNQFNVAIS